MKRSNVLVSFFRPGVTCDGTPVVSEWRIKPGTVDHFSWIDGRPIKGPVRRLSCWWGGQPWELFEAWFHQR